MSNNDVKETKERTHMSYEGTYPSVPSFHDIHSSEDARIENFKAGESVQIFTGAVKKVLHVNKARKLAQVSGYRWWFPFSELRKVK